MFRNIEKSSSTSYEETQDTSYEKVQEDYDLKIASQYIEDDRPKIEKFINIYGFEEINKDLRAIDNSKKNIEKSNNNRPQEERKELERNKTRANIFEYIISSEGHKGEWFGEQTMVSMTSEYDDLVNGVDLIVEIPVDENKKMYFAIDASFSSDPEIIKNKVDKNIKKITSKNGLPEVKYFESQEFKEENGKIKQEMGKLQNLLPVVIGAEKNNISELFENFVELKNLEETNGPKNKTRELRHKLASHPLQLVFLEEIRTQLKTYWQILNELPERKKECEKLIEFIEKTIEEKKENKISLNYYFQNDKTYKNIKDASKKDLSEKVALKVINKK